MNLKESFAEALASISQTADANTVIGEAVTTANGTIIIPVSKLGLGYVSGGVDGSAKKDKEIKPAEKFIGGGGTGVTVSPVAFLVVAPDGSVELLNINQPTIQTADPISSIIGAIERSPELIEKFREVFSKDKKEKAEIGVYCQHVCYPENSRFSLILLHDLAQGHNRWPNLWENERWNGFDIGIVPGKSWADRWRKCACFYYANPRCGTFEFGYPKSDCINDIGILNRGAEVKKLLAMPDRFTVLYAPSWENDNKEDDFIKSLQNLDINLMVKQAAWPEVYQHIRGNIEYMRSIHEGRFENLYYIEPEESIMTALSLCDMVVSDESSVMAEALMFGKPSVAVTDWMIPDEDPPRPASVPMDYVIKCEKKDLREKVLSIMNHSEEYEDILQKGRDTFSNQGNVCKDIMDAIDYYTQGGTEDSFMSRKLESEYRAFNMWN